MSFIGALIRLTDHPLYVWYARAPRVFPGFTALQDQGVGGLIMWIPGMLFFWTWMTFVWFRWARRAERQEPVAIPLST